MTWISKEVISLSFCSDMRYVLQVGMVTTAWVLLSIPDRLSSTGTAAALTSRWLLTRSRYPGWSRLPATLCITL